MEQEWLLLDMHLHSEYSKINKPSESGRVKKMSAKVFVDTLIDKKVKIFSITDHNYFSKKYYDEVDNYLHENEIAAKIINGVELDVYVILNDNSEDFIHICVYFDDSIDREKLENTVSELYSNSDGTLKKPRFNEILERLQSLQTKFIIIPHGDKDRGILANHLLDKLDYNEIPEFYKYAMYKIFNAFDVKLAYLDKSNEFWASSFCENTKKFNSLIKDKNESEIDNIKKNISTKIRNREFSLTEDEQNIYNYVLNYGSYFAYFVFSDWHNNEQYKPKINNFIFGNLEYSFSAFEMATLDPVSRIIKSMDDEIYIPPTILKSVNFKIDGVSKEIKFSPGLNAVVGKRGSGKSLLLAVIKNLVSQNDDDGALKLYSKLNVTDINAKNRANIELSLGSLDSVAFLTQNDIKDIFEDPGKAQRTIASNFLSIGDLDLSGLSRIIDIGTKILPYNNDYKNITANILTMKRSSDYNYSTLSSLDEIVIKSNFMSISNEFDKLIKTVETMKLDSTNIVKEKERVNILKNYYIFLITSYNSIIENSNERIVEINSKRTNNQITIKQNIKDINAAIINIRYNFEIQLNIEKIMFSLKKYEMSSPPVEVNRKGKYLFVTYYEIPDNINEVIEEKVLDSITRSSDINDIYKYVSGDGSRKIKNTYTSIVDGLKKLVNGDYFKCKKEFFEIRNIGLDYKNIITNMGDLENHLRMNDIINLTDSSPGMKSVAYLDMLFDLEEKILILDQPEDNIDNDYISNYLVPNIKGKKQVKQLVFVTHNPSVAVYGDAFNYIFVENDGDINYTNYLIEKSEDKEKLINILEGGRHSFSNRNKKFGNILGDEEYEINKK
ncbi:MAG: hypothetical protein RR623_06785 [Bacilli bacterium]